MRIRLALAVIVGSSLGGHLDAQMAATGAAAGRVTAAATGKPVAAEVLLDGTRTVRADQYGAWRIEDVAVGAHLVRVRYPGYRARDLAVAVAAGQVTIANASLAQAIVPLSAVIVTAARREQRLADAVVETELIGRNEIEESGAGDLAAVLARRTGMELDGGIPAGAGVQIRGMDSRRVLVLLDGQPVAGRINGNFDLSRLPVGAVERIEIVKGPQSTLYGSEAMGGVINIVTRRAPVDVPFVGSLSMTGGSSGRRDAAGEVGIRRGALGFLVNGGRRAIELVPGRAGDAGTFARRWDGSANVRWGGTSARWTELSTLGVVERQRYRTGQLFNFADNTQLGATWSAVTDIGEKGGRVTATASLSQFEHLSRASTLDRPVSDSGARDRQRLLHSTLLYNTVVRRVSIDAGLDATRESIDADRVQAPSKTTIITEPFLQATRTWGTLTLTPGLRLTASDRWGNFVAPRLAGLWRPVPAVAVRGSLGQGFRAPDFKELYLNFVNTAVGYAVRGNPDLQPESSTSASLGAEWDAPSRYGRLTTFRQAYHDFIETGEPDLSGSYTYRNVARGTALGAELEGGMFAGAWRLDGSYGYLRTRDAATGTPLLGRPSHRSSLAATAPVVWGTRVAVTASYTAATPVDRSTTGLTRMRDGFSRVDVRVMRAVAAGVDAALGVTNLFDRRLGDDWPGFTGRQLHVTLGWRSLNH
ncbi:MAG: TonB-dependent receptor [Gemmatimonadaceae bacterium]